MLLRWRRLLWECQKANYTYAPPDALIALEHELGVVTRNAVDFARAGVRLLDPWVGPA